MEKLSDRCGVCGSWSWCGRQCLNAKKAVQPQPVFNDGPLPKGRAIGGVRAKKRSPYAHFCGWCGTEFEGSSDKLYCSDSCRVSGWRLKKREDRVGTEKPAKRQPYKWGIIRFEVLKRDGFKCRYCGRGAAQNAVLQVDHVKSKADGGSSEMSNLVTACQECNMGKACTSLEAPPS